MQFLQISRSDYIEKHVHRSHLHPLFKDTEYGLKGSKKLVKKAINDSFEIFFEMIV